MSHGTCECCGNVSAKRVILVPHKLCEPCMKEYTEVKNMYDDESDSCILYVTIRKFARAYTQNILSFYQKNFPQAQTILSECGKTITVLPDTFVKYAGKC